MVREVSVRPRGEREADSRFCMIVATSAGDISPVRAAYRPSADVSRLGSPHSDFQVECCLLPQSLGSKPAIALTNP